MEERKARVLIVDDTPINIKVLSDALKDDYKISVAQSGKKALELVRNPEQPDIILLDVMMPEMDGYEVCRKLKSDTATKKIPVIFVTAMSEEQDETLGFDVGAVDYITKPFSIPLARQRIGLHIELKRYRDSLEELVNEQTLIIQKERDHAVLLRDKAEKQLEDFLMVLATAIESKDPYTGRHVERVALFSRDLAAMYGIAGKELNDLYLGAIVHDVGKIGVRESVLNKQGKLEPEEFEHIKMHPVFGRNILSKLEDIEVAYMIAYHHQERWDGNGYPDGLSGTRIPLVARIVTVADYWDAITSDRPYRPAMPVEKAMQIMRDERGKAFQPELLDLFLDDKEKIYLRYLDRR
jgi:putative two-component system response regulator